MLHGKQEVEIFWAKRQHLFPKLVLVNFLVLTLSCRF